jgi:glutaredoxin 3
VKQDPVKLKEMLLHSKGIRKVPVIVEDGKVSIGYGGS